MGDYPRIDTIHGRAYIIEPGRIAPSVTSVLRATQDDSSLRAWKKKVGEKEANRRRDEGSKRGDALHLAMERWCETGRGDEGEGPWWDSIQSALPRIIQPLFTETAVASKKEGEEACGTIDLGAMWRTERYGVRCAVCDYKTANRAKENRYLSEYRLQLGAYLSSDEALEMGMEVGVLIITAPKMPAQILELAGPSLDAACSTWSKRLSWYHADVAGAWVKVREAADGLY